MIIQKVLKKKNASQLSDDDDAKLLNKIKSLLKSN